MLTVSAMLESVELKQFDGAVGELDPNIGCPVGEYAVLDVDEARR
jgi:hypothetical protein